MSAAKAGTASGTARIQALLDNPVHGTVNLPSGTFTISQPLRLHQGERIIGHHTTLRVAAGLGDYAAMLAGAGNGITITGNKFVGTDNLNTIVTGGGTRNVTISGNSFQTRNAALH